MQLAHRRRPQPLGARTEERSHGAVLVEAVFATPIFFMLVMGIAEVGLAMNDNLALAHSARAGSRFASAAGADPYTDFGILRSIERESAALPQHQVELIVVYRANRFGELPSDTCRAGTPGPTCNVYRPEDFEREREDFGCVDGEGLDEYWCPMDRQVVLTSTTGPDFVGVWMKVRHPWVTGMFGSEVTLTDSSVIQLEPRERRG